MLTDFLLIMLFYRCPAYAAGCVSWWKYPSHYLRWIKATTWEASPKSMLFLVW